MPYRNSEKRKEKSRDAARSRRGKETEVFYDLAQELPLTTSVTSQLDKASIMRLSISHLKLRKLLGQGKDGVKGEQPTALEKKINQLYSKALEGFLLVIAQEGDIMFLSEAVADHLGLTQIELLGHSVYDFTHPCDHDEIKEMLQERTPGAGGAGGQGGQGGATSGATEDRTFFMRMKCTLTSKGRNINLKSASYKVLRCCGRFVAAGTRGQQLPGLSRGLPCLVLTAEPIPHPANIEIPLDSLTFVSRHSMNMRFTYCDERVLELLGYKGCDLLDKCFYDYSHALDAEMIEKSYKTLFAKGQTQTERYRFLAYGGGFAWVETQATVITNPRTDKPQCVVCVHSVLSSVTEAQLILSDVQQPKAKVEPSVLPSGLILSTESIFAPRPKDTNLDMFKETEMGDTDDMIESLMQLAPSAGDVMMPLEFPLSYEDPDSLIEDGLYPTDYAYDGPQPFDLGLGAPLSAGPIYGKHIPLNSIPLNDSKVPDLDCLSGDSRPPSMMSAVTTCSTSKDRDKDICGPSSVTGIDDLEDVDFDMRAPYIPMDGDEDQVYNLTMPTPLLDDDNGPSQMLGTTESVFAPRPPEAELGGKPRYPTPLSVLRLQANHNYPDSSVGEIARNAGPPKMKRPMETNRLETGPPVCKSRRLGAEQLGAHCLLGGPVGGGGAAPALPPGPKAAASATASATITRPDNDMASASEDSVLMNLLIKGEDVNYGYRIQDTLLDMDCADQPQPLTLSGKHLQSSYDDSDSDYIDLVSGDSSPFTSPLSSPYSTPAATPTTTSHININNILLSGSSISSASSGGVGTTCGGGIPLTGGLGTARRLGLLSGGASSSVGVGAGLGVSGLMGGQPVVSLAQSNLVVIRTDNNTLLFAPLAGGRGGALQQM